MLRIAFWGGLRLGRGEEGEGEDDVSAVCDFLLLTFGS